VFVACLAGCTSGKFRTFSVPVVYPKGYVARFDEDSLPVRGVTTVDVTHVDFNEDKTPDGLLVRFYPLGPGKRPVKKLGNVRIIAYKKMMDTLDIRGRELAQWRLTRAELARQWVSGPYMSCFQIRLVWPEGRPNVRWAVVDLIFEDSSGAAFTFTERTVTVGG